MNSFTRVCFLAGGICMLLAIGLSSEFRYRNLSVQDGLSSHVIYDIIQDSRGFIWIASEGGLDRYDGYTFKSYLHDSAQPGGLHSNHISRILESSHAGVNYLWLDALDGLYRLNLRTDRVEEFRRIQGDSTSISSNNIRAMVNGADGFVWIGTKGGLNRYSYESNSFSLVLPDVQINELYGDAAGILWLGTYDEGLIRYDPHNNEIRQYRHDPTDSTTISGDSIARGMLDSEFHGSDHLWVSTLGAGFNLLDKTTGEFTRFIPQPPNKTGNASVHFETHDAGGHKLWVRSHPEGFHVMDLETGEFTHHNSDSDRPNGLSSYLVQWMYKDCSGTIWFGTYAGLDILNRQELQFNQMKRDLNTENGISDDIIGSLYVGSGDALWVGTAAGLDRLDLTSGEFTNFTRDMRLPEAVRESAVTSIREDLEGNIWVATNYGVHRFPKDLSSVKTFLPDQHDPNSLSHQYINWISRDPAGNMWISTYSGLERYNPISGGFDHYLEWAECSATLFLEDSDTSVVLLTTRSGLVELDPATREFTIYKTSTFEQGNLSNERVHDLYQDSHGIVWIATNYGLNWTDPHERVRSKLRFQHYTEDDGLPNNTVQSIIEDDNGYLWITTSAGISRFDHETGTFRNYDAGDGLGSALFYHRALVKDRRGRLYAGSLGGGITSFHPDSLKENTHVPPVQLTDFEVFHKPVPIRPDGDRKRRQPFSLPRSISFLDEIQMSYRQNVFTITFAALDFRNPYKNQYAYRLTGFSPEWIYTDADERAVTYTNLDPGEYVFQVRASNNDGLWNETGVSLGITITPPWWKSGIAYLLYALLGGGLVFLVYRIRINRLKLKHQLELEKLEAERYQEMDQLKSRFFANISHEFRTPLTLILGPLEELIRSTRETRLKGTLETMQAYARRMLDLVSQLLDLSRMEAHPMPLRVKEHNCIPLLKGLTLSFASVAERENISLTFHSELEDIRLYYDKESLVKVVNNLLSNAFKFTPSGGTVDVFVEVIDNREGYAEGAVEISVADNGPGIPADQMDRIFERFYRGADEAGRVNEGSGIGLALARELVALHHGEILVTSEVDMGATFTVQLPLGSAHLSEEEIERFMIPDEEVETARMAVDPARIPMASPDGKPLLLLVEDNTDVRSYTLDVLRKEYHCLEAADGHLGLEMIWEHLPEIVVSDIMMPGMDGLEFCRRVKADERSSHIPVILLTARADRESRLEGLETGADAYMTKPFDAQELSVRIRNLLSVRRQLIKRFRLDVEPDAADLDLSSMDERFMRKVMDQIQEQLDDMNLNVDSLAHELHVTRQHLNRKLHALTGQSASHFIRSIRLKRAVVLMRHHTESVTQIAYQVGFRNPAHFAKCFREQFGLLPSEYYRQYAEISDA